MTIYVHGWYGQGTYYADDLSLTGPGGRRREGGTAPAAPTGLSVTGTTASSVSLSWTAPGGTVTGYHVYQGGTLAATTSATSATITGLTASTSYTFTVTAYNSAGESAASGAVTATTSSSGGGGGSGSYAVAPYVDMTNNQEPMLNQAATQAGLKAFSAAFVIASGCTPIWGDTLPVTNDPTVTSEITTAEADGAQPIVSFGGESGVELADSCSNLSQLTAAYQSVINTLHVTHIDFDIEGAEIAYTAQNNLRFQAINALEAANPGLVVSVTIPVNPNGPDANGQAFLQEAPGQRDPDRCHQRDDHGLLRQLGHWQRQHGRVRLEAAQDTLAYAQTAVAQHDLRQHRRHPHDRPERRLRRGVHRGQRADAGQLRRAEPSGAAGVLVGGPGPALRQQRERPAAMLGNQPAAAGLHPDIHPVHRLISARHGRGTNGGNTVPRPSARRSLLALRCRRVI